MVDYVDFLSSGIYSIKITVCIHTQLAAERLARSKEVGHTRSLVSSLKSTPLSSNYLDCGRERSRLNSGYEDLP
jgi:hypothetical protein